MRQILLALAATVLLAACTVDPVPKGYTGPLAYIEDSSVERTGTSIDLFFLSEVNGEAIDDSYMATAQANQGLGFYQKAKVIGRKVPAQAAAFIIEGQTRSAAPVASLFNEEFIISGIVKVTPQPDRTYVVKGEMSDTHCAVWIEDKTTGEILGGQKVEQNGCERPFW